MLAAHDKVFLKIKPLGVPNMNGDQKTRVVNILLPEQVEKSPVTQDN